MVICKCKYQCKDVLHSKKLKLFQQLYTLKDNVAQNSYLMGLLNVCAVKRRCNGDVIPEESRKQATVYFTSLHREGKCVQVCKKCFYMCLTSIIR